MAIFRFFKTAAAAILDFRNFKFSTVGAVWSVEHYTAIKLDAVSVIVDCIMTDATEKKALDRL